MCTHDDADPADRLHLRPKRAAGHVRGGRRAGRYGRYGSGFADDGAWLLVDGRVQPLTSEFDSEPSEGVLEVQVVDLAGNVSDVVVSEDDSAGGCSSTSTSSGLWACALLVLAHRRRRQR